MLYEAARGWTMEKAITVPNRWKITRLPHKFDEYRKEKFTYRAFEYWFGGNGKKLVTKRF